MFETWLDKRIKFFNLYLDDACHFCPFEELQEFSGL